MSRENQMKPTQRLGRPVGLDGLVDGLLEAEDRAGGVGRA